MITVISGTNRTDNLTVHFARRVVRELKKQTDQKVNFLHLADLPHDWFHALMYTEDGQSKSLRKIQDKYILPAEKFVFVIPEYNGGMPGVLKMFIDACSIRRYKDNFQGKKAAVMGTSSGRAGNLRGMEHLTGVLNYLGTTVMPNRQPISGIGNLIDAENVVQDKATLKIIKAFAKQVVDF